MALDDLLFSALRETHRILDGCPSGREKSLAITKLEECEMWAERMFPAEEKTPPSNGIDLGRYEG